MSTIISCFQLCFICSLAFVLITIKGQTLRIGAIFDPSTRKGKEEYISIKLAVEQLGSSTTILLDDKYLNGSDPLLASYYAQELVEQGDEIIIATGTSLQVLFAGEVGSKAEIPIISLVPSSLSSKPFLAEMSYPYTVFIKCVVAIVRSFNWRRVIAVYEDDEHSTMSKTALLFSLALREVGSELEYSAIFTPTRNGSYPNLFIQDELIRMQKQLSTVYVILRGSEYFALSLFQEATKLGMLGKGYVWICGNDISSLIDSTFDSSFQSNYLQGVLGVESYINESTPSYRKFSSEFQQSFETEYKRTGETVFTPGVFAFRAYDIVQTLALAAVESQKNNRSLAENLVASNLTGFSEGIPVFRIINVVGKSYKVLGFWLDSLGFYDNEVELRSRERGSDNLTVVFWPGRPIKVPGGLRKLRVGIPANPVWDRMIKLDTKNKGVSNPSGFCIDVFLAILDKMSYKFEYDYVPFNLGKNRSLDYEFQTISEGTNSTQHFTYDDLVDEVYLKKVDLVVGDVTILARRAERVSFTQPFMSSGLVMLVPLEDDNPRWLLLWPFKATLWLAIFGTMTCTFFAVWFLEKFDDQADDDFRGLWYKQIGATLWIIGNTVFQTYGDRIGSYYTKAVILCWLLVVLILSSSYTANLSSILVINSLKPRVSDSKIGCNGYGFDFNYLKDVLHYKQDIVQVTNSSDYPNAFQNGTITAAFLEIPYVRVFLEKYKGYTVYGDTRMLGGLGFVLPKFSTMTFDMSKAILELEEDGTLAKIEDKWFSVHFKPTISAMDSTNKQRLGIGSFLSLFIFSLFVSVGAIAIFIIRKKKSNQIEPITTTEDIEEQEANSQEQKQIDLHEQIRKYSEVRSKSFPN